MKRITSRDNSTYKLLRALNESGRERRKQGRMVLDGVHLVESYLDSGGDIELLAASESGLAQREIRAILDRFPGGRTVILADALFREASAVTTPAGIAAVAHQPPAPRLELHNSCVVLDAIQDAGNVGAILRATAAAGIGDVLLGPGCAQAWSPRVLRAGMGAHFALRIHEHADLPQALAGFPGRIVTTRLDAERSLYDLDLGGAIAWLFGNEGAGVSEALDAAAHERIRIPMSDKVESLNVATAAAVCLFEERRQKLRIRADRA